MEQFIVYRLEDISANHKWCRSHQITVDGSPDDRTEGQPTRGLLREWVQLRTDAPELLSGLRIWGQPRAWSDSIIQSWWSDLIHEHTPQCVTVCDCFTGQWSEVALHSAYLNHQLQIPVGPDVTSILQMADLSVIGQSKHAAERCKDRLTVLLTQSARKEGV